MTTSLPSGLDLFDTLRAQDEFVWFSQVFIPPSGFDTMRGMRSIIVFGDEGSGKTMLRLSLIAAAQESADADAPLIVEWQPGIHGEMDGETFVTQAMNEIFDLTAQALGRYLAEKPESFWQATRWAQEGMIWLVHRYMRTDKDLFLLRLEGKVPAEGLDCVSQIFTRSPKALISFDAPLPRQMTEVVEMLKAAGFGGLWVILDGLESWLMLDSAVLGKMLTALFSTLALFDVPGFAVKVMAPLRLRNLVSASTGLGRRRFDIFELEWTKEMLHTLCERRLALACRREEFSLEFLSESPELVAWLEKYGGTSPRGWLDFFRAFLDAYLSQTVQQPLNFATILDIHQRFPPRLRMDAAGECIFLGYHPISDISASSVAILRYLYQHPVRSCSKEELYYRGLRGLSKEPRAIGDPGREDPKTVEGIMDTALWRLRQSVEPEPKRPIYIVSTRGKGVIQLENAW